MRKKVLYTKDVMDAIDNISSYIVEEFNSPVAALKFEKDITNFLLSLGNFPQAHPLNRYSQLRQYGGENLRKAVFRRKWTILFEVKGHYVVIQKILHGSNIIGKS